MIKENWIDKLVKSDSVNKIRRFVTGALMSTCMLPHETLKGIGGSLGIFAITGVAANAIGIAQHHFNKKRKQKELLNYYEDEIAAIQHKQGKDLTLEDLLEVARPVEQGGKGINVIADQLAEYNYAQKFFTGVGLASALSMSGGLLGLTSFETVDRFITDNKAIALAVGLGITGTGFLAIRNVVETIGEHTFGKPEKHTLSHQLMELSGQVKDISLEPSQLFSIFAQANPELEAKIEKRYGQKYDDLTALQKKDAVRAFEPEYKITALTQAVNRGDMKISSIAFISTGQGENEIPAWQKYKDLTPAASQPHLVADHAHDNLPYIHTKKLLAQRQREQEASQQTEVTLH